MRRDAVRNRRKLLEAVGEALRTEPGAMTMAVIAERPVDRVEVPRRVFDGSDLGRISGARGDHGDEDSSKTYRASGKRQRRQRRDGEEQAR
jgi:hypothetical protein